MEEEFKQERIEEGREEAADDGQRQGRTWTVAMVDDYDNEF